MNEKLYKEIAAFQPYDEKERADQEVMLEFIRSSEDVLTRDNRIAHVTATAWIVNKNRDKVLMVYHNIYNSWAWVGGHADGEEDLLHVVKKEVSEETGLLQFKVLSDGIYALNIVPVDNHIKRGKIVTSHLHFDVEYLLEADEKDAVRMKEDENSGVKWIDIAKIDKYVSEENMKPVYARLNEKLALINGSPCALKPGHRST